MSKGNPGINRLGRVIRNQMQQAADSPLVLDFGTIQSDYSLITDSFPLPIPKSDYMVCRDLTHSQKQPLTATSSVTVGNETHKHDVITPDSMKVLAAGDRVLVAWVQNDAVVIDVIVEASEIGG
jgi:hypothetical protein